MLWAAAGGATAGFATGSRLLPAIAGSCGGAAAFTDSVFGFSAGGVFSAAGSEFFSAEAVAATEIPMETTWSFCTTA